MRGENLANRRVDGAKGVDRDTNLGQADVVFPECMREGVRFGECWQGRSGGRRFW